MTTHIKKYYYLKIHNPAGEHHGEFYSISNYYNTIAETRAAYDKILSEGRTAKIMRRIEIFIDEAV